MGVKVERQGHAAVVTLDWPEQRNSMGPDECKQLSAALANVADDQSVCGVVITGNGAFCSGGNLKGTAERTGMPEEERRKIVYGAYQGMIRSVIGVPVPTVAAVDGPAIGMGLDIALACDSRFIGPKGWAMQGWGRVGFVPGTGGELLLRLRAPGLLWKLLEEQQRIDAAGMEKMGIGESSGEMSALERAVQRVNALAPMSRESLGFYVELHRDFLRRELDHHLEMAVTRQIKVLSNPDVKARIAAVMKK